MITQIEIDGFKTFKDFKVELAPFQVIVGANGSGKSNLFDALNLLSRLAEDDVATAFQAVRGYTNEQFTRFPNGKSAERMRFAVEILVDREIQDETAKVLRVVDGVPQKQNEVKFRRMRYELELATETDDPNLERIYIAHESLETIPLEQDSWCQRHNLSPENGWLSGVGTRTELFIKTESVIRDIKGSFQHVSDTPLITIFREEQPLGNTTQYRARDLNRTALSLMKGIDNLHIIAVREEMLSWRFLHLNPEAIREPSHALISPSTFLTQNGGNLPTTLARIEKDDGLAFHLISLDMANLVSDVMKVRVEKNPASNEYEIWIDTYDQRTFSAQALSDGTLRLLALATVRNDPLFHGLLCLEEPENGVNPKRLKELASMLREMATDFNDPEQVSEPLRQVLITTHSPAFISLPEVIHSLIFAYTISNIEPLSSGKPSLEITCISPVITPQTQDHYASVERNEQVFTLDRVLRYLDNEDLASARNQLTQARTTLNK